MMHQSTNSLPQPVRPNQTAATAGLFAEAQALSTRIKARISIDLGDPPLIDRLRPEVQDALQHILHETLNNVAMYAYPRTVTIRARMPMDKLEQGLWLIIIDDGRGFDMAKTQPGTGHIAIRQLAESVGATVWIHSIEGKGTTVSVLVPPGPQTFADGQREQQRIEAGKEASHIEGFNSLWALSLGIGIALLGDATRSLFENVADLWLNSVIALLIVCVLSGFYTWFKAKELQKAALASASDRACLALRLRTYQITNWVLVALGCCFGAPALISNWMTGATAFWLAWIVGISFIVLAFVLVFFWDQAARRYEMKANVLDLYEQNKTHFAQDSNAIVLKVRYAVAGGIWFFINASHVESFLFSPQQQDWNNVVNGSICGLFVLGFVLNYLRAHRMRKRFAVQGYEL